MSSKTAICNTALARIGVFQPIASIDEASQYGRACKAFYDDCRQQLLREIPWPFALRYETLALVSEDPNPDWGFAYRFPANYLKCYQLVSSGSSVSLPDIYASLSLGYVPSFQQRYPWQVGSDTQGRLIYTDLEDAIVYGAFDVEDTALFDPQFSSALSWRIAAEIAPGICKDRSITERANQMAAALVSNAAASAFNEAVPKDSEEAGTIQAMN
jgi:hypothetical protein